MADAPLRIGDLGEVDPQALTAYLTDRRWYGARQLTPIGATIRTTTPISDEPPLVVTLVEVRFQTGAAAVYQLLLGLRDADPAGPGVIATTARGVLYDALDAPDATVAVIPAFDTRARVGEKGSRVAFHTAGRDAPVGPVLVARPARHEQTNTSVIYDDRLILKWYRHLEPGPNPELEVLRFLAEHEFPHTPDLLGWIEHHGQPLDATLAMLQRFAEGTTDGWELVTGALREGAGERVLGPLRELGSVTGELHATLAAERSDPAFVPEEVSSEGLALMSAGLDEVATDLFGALPEDHPELAGLTGREDEIRDRLQGVSRTAGLGRKIRVHGDLHLGQALRGTAGWLLVDFEGEPARPINERRRKRSPLRDVAGLTRSLAYAAGACELHHGAPVPAGWLPAAREALLQGYLAVVEPTGLLPPTGPVTEEVLTLYELEKAVYELRYELAHRPEWAAIPARGIGALLDRTA